MIRDRFLAWCLVGALVVPVVGCSANSSNLVPPPPPPAPPADTAPPPAPPSPVASSASSAALAAPLTPSAPTSIVAKDPLDTPVIVSDALRKIVEAKDRSEGDRALDAGRHPAELLAFLGAAPGQRIAEIGSYEGYTAELLARAVMPNGKAYAQDTAGINKFTKKAWEARKASPAMKNIVRVERPFDAPIPPDLKGLDAVVCGLFYHDMVWLNVDRAKMNSAIFRALKSGGVYFVYDHSAKEGAATGDAKTLHRIEEKTVREEIEAAGFKLAATASFLRHPEDKRDWSASDEAPKELRGTSDRFVLKFVKP